MENETERSKDDRNLRHNRGSPNAAKWLLEKLPFELQNDEKIVRELKPQFVGFMLERTLGGYLSLLGLVVVLTIVLTIFRANLSGFAVELFLLPVLLLFFILLIALKPVIEYDKSWYWITNHRVIGKRGFLSYSINSIPLENVTDVVLTRSVLDRLTGLSSLIVVPMGTSSMSEGRTDNEKAQSPNFFPALTQETARELQRQLLNLRDDLKKQDQAAAVATVRSYQQAPPPIKTHESRKGSTQESIQPRRSSSTSSKA